MKQTEQIELLKQMGLYEQLTALQLKQRDPKWKLYKYEDDK